MIRRPASTKRNRIHISPSRAGRLYRLLRQVSGGAVLRSLLLKRLRVGQRTFYRDIDLLRECGIDVAVDGEGYSLTGTLAEALHLLPFPDPELTFGDIEVLMRGRSQTHEKMRTLFKRITK